MSVDRATHDRTSGLYSGPVTVSSTATLKAIAYESGWIDSAVTSAAYTIGGGTVATPTINPPGGTYGSAQTVTISTTTTGASIRYTVNGSTPSQTAGTLYTGPFTVSSTSTIKAIAYESGWIDSAVASVGLGYAVFRYVEYPTVVDPGTRLDISIGRDRNKGRNRCASSPSLPPPRDRQPRASDHPLITVSACAKG